MPDSQLQVLAKKTGKPKAEIEKLYAKAKKLAADAGKKNDFAYIYGILTNMLGIEESVEYDKSTKSLEEYLDNEDEEEEEIEEEIISADISVRPERSPIKRKKYKKEFKKRNR